MFPMPNATRTSCSAFLHVWNSSDGSQNLDYLVEAVAGAAKSKKGVQGRGNDPGIIQWGRLTPLNTRQIIGSIPKLSISHFDSLPHRSPFHLSRRTRIQPNTLNSPASEVSFCSSSDFQTLKHTQHQPFPGGSKNQTETSRTFDRSRRHALPQSRRKVLTIEAGAAARPPQSPLSFEP